jgi:polar amino acid transport system substrate-binding protein
MLLLPWTSCGESISVLTYEWRPFNYEEGGQVKGISTEVIREVLKRANLEAEIQVYPWVRAYQRAMEEENVLLFTIARTPEREAHFKFLCPIAPSVHNVLFKLRERTDISVSSVKEAGRYRIGVQNGDVIHQILLGAGLEVNKTLFPVTDNEQNLKKLLSGRIDLMAGHDLPTQDLLKGMNLAADFLEVVYTFESFEECAAFGAKTSDELVERARRALESVVGEGLIENVARRHLGR